MPYLSLPKIMSAVQTRAADQFTIANCFQSSWELMEQASLAFTDAVAAQLEGRRVAVFCGTGNNGGDGLAVSRMLQTRGIATAAFLVKFNNQLSVDCQVNFDKLETVTTLQEDSELPDLAAYDVVIDAIFGSGLSRPVQGLAAKIISHINKSGLQIYAIDLPSGLYSDRLSDSDVIVRADLTISFQRPKLAFFFPENALYLKDWKVVDIGLDEDYIQQQASDHLLLGEKISAYLRPRARWSHKGTYGHALLMAGSYGKMGAAVLAARACLRSGVGLLTTYVPRCDYNIMQIGVPEAMCMTDSAEQILSEVPDLQPYKVVGIGPGIGKDTATVNMLRQLLQKPPAALVIDADALNILSENADLLALLPPHSILTPHIKEFDRLVGKCANATERFAKQKIFSQQYQCIVVLKDAHTCVSSPGGQLYFNTSGNPGMATGGSGDVLTGIITGLVAQSYESLLAALLGVYYHGRAGDCAAAERGMAGMIASDIVDGIEF